MDENGSPRFSFFFSVQLHREVKILMYMQFPKMRQPPHPYILTTLLLPKAV